MKRTEIKQSLRRGAQELPQPDFDAIANAPIHKMETHDYITRQEEPKAKQRHAIRATVTSVCLAACVLVFCLFGYQSWTAYQTIDLDVNPSFEITTNRWNDVLRVEGMNEEAKSILQGNYRGRNLSDVLSALMAASNSGGYLASEDNAVLVTVSSPDKRAQSRSEISGQVRAALNSLGVSGSVYSQTLQESEELALRAREFGISHGKMQLIHAITSQRDGYSEEQLAASSIAQIIEIIEREGIDADLQRISVESESTEPTETEPASTAPSTTTAPPTTTEQPAPAPDISDVDGQRRLDEIIQGYAELGALMADNADGRHDEEIERRQRELEDALEELGGDYAEMGREIADYYRDFGESAAKENESRGQEIADKFKDYANDIVDKFRP